MTNQAPKRMAFRVIDCDDSPVCRSVDSGSQRSL